MAALGLNITDLARLEVDLTPLGELIVDLKASKASAEAQLDAPNRQSITAQISNTAKAIKSAKAQLDQPSFEYEAYLKVFAEWEATRVRLLEGTEEEEGLQQVETALKDYDLLPGRIADLKSDRDANVRSIHFALVELVGIYEELYRPAREFIADHVLATKARLEFQAALRERTLEPRFWEIVGRNVTGSFMGLDHGAAALRKMIEGTNFDDVESALVFAIELEEALHSDIRHDPPQPAEIGRVRSNWALGRSPLRPDFRAYLSGAFLSAAIQRNPDRSAIPRRQGNAVADVLLACGPEPASAHSRPTR